jgi:hypothetical protein
MKQIGCVLIKEGQGTAFIILVGLHRASYEMLFDDVYSVPVEFLSEDRKYLNITVSEESDDYSSITIPIQSEKDLLQLVPSLQSNVEKNLTYLEIGYARERANAHLIGLGLSPVLFFTNPPTVEIAKVKAPDPLVLQLRIPTRLISTPKSRRQESRKIALIFFGLGVLPLLVIGLFALTHSKPSALVGVLLFLAWYFIPSLYQLSKLQLDYKKEHGTWSPMSLHSAPSISWAGKQYGKS